MIKIAIAYYAIINGAINTTVDHFDYVPGAFLTIEDCLTARLRLEKELVQYDKEQNKYFAEPKFMIADETTMRRWQQSNSARPEYPSGE